MKKNINIILTAIVAVTVFLTGCQKGDLLSNPNVVAETSTVPVSLILNHLTATLMKEEEPIISNCYRYNQNVVSNYTYYAGTNGYGWTNTSHTYDNIKYCVKMEEQALKQYGSTNNIYAALSKFFKAYSFIWLTQRVGDIPMVEAGNPTNLTPKYNTQKEVFQKSLALLDSANLQIAALTPVGKASSKIDATGDIFGLTYLQWQKVINSYRLRVLISLSKRADDNADLNIKSQFAAIIGDAVKYPLIGANADNMVYRFNAAYNQYPPIRIGNTNYNNCFNINKTFINVTAAYNDPRTFVLMTPSKAAITSGKTISDFTAYIGEDNNKAQTLMSSFSTDGQFSCVSYNRYYSSAAGANCEPYILVGYPELCFNIAEAANRGWISGQSAATWYNKGIMASMDLYGITQGKIVTVGNEDNTKPNLGTVALDLTNFLANPNVLYVGDNATGLNQILTQKYVAFFMNSGFESFYQWRRTGVPALAQGGVGVGTPSLQIPSRWKYPQDEITYNAANNSAAVASQYGGTDDIFAKMWMIK
jgi:hypothetical protein